MRETKEDKEDKEGTKESRVDGNTETEEEEEKKDGAAAAKEQVEAPKVKKGLPRSSRAWLVPQLVPEPTLT